MTTEPRYEIKVTLTYKLTDRFAHAARKALLMAYRERCGELPRNTNITVGQLLAEFYEMGVDPQEVLDRVARYEPPWGDCVSPAGRSTYYIPDWANAGLYRAEETTDSALEAGYVEGPEAAVAHERGFHAPLPVAGCPLCSEVDK